MYVSNLDGLSESPPNASPGLGSAEIDFDTTANTLRVQFCSPGCSGQRRPAHPRRDADARHRTADRRHDDADIPGFPPGVTAGTYDSGLLDLTSATSYNPAFITANGGTTAGAEAALLAGAAAGTSHLNIHTSVVPGGEIRGFLTPVPEPSSLAPDRVCRPARPRLLAPPPQAGRDLTGPSRDRRSRRPGDPFSRAFRVPGGCEKLSGTVFTWKSLRLDTFDLPVSAASRRHVHGRIP